MTGRATKPKRATAAERGLQLYQTPEEATVALLEEEEVPHRVAEMAVGRGAIARVLIAAGHDVACADVKLWRGRPEGTERLDFIRDRIPRRFRGRAHITNPPFGEAPAFIARALRMSPWCAFLLRFAFFEGGAGPSEASAQRRLILDTKPPARILVFRRRLPRMHRDGWEGAMTSSDTAYAWFIWSGETKPGETLIRRIDWRPVHRVGRGV